MPNIAVVGAGVGGLACARALQINNVDVTVFERESSQRARWQGGMLDLHVPTGQAALHAAGLYEQFRAFARPEAQELRVLDPGTGELIHHELPVGGDRFAPEIDRGHLRELLLNSLRPNTVHWGQPMEFADERLREFDLVVGADGAWSRIRPALSPATPSYQGSIMIETWLDDVDTRHPGLAALVGPGSLVATEGRTILSAQRNSGGHVRVYTGLEMPLDWYVTERVDLADPRSVRAFLLAKLAGWHEPLLDLIRRSDGEFVNRPMYVLPVGHSWDHVPGYTLLGDAAHLMPPYGIGANLALIDGTDLAQAIAAHPNLDDAVRAYEAVMLPRAAAAAQACVELTENLSEGSTHDVDAARQLLNERMSAAGN